MKYDAETERRLRRLYDALHNHFFYGYEVEPQLFSVLTRFWCSDRKLKKN